VQTVLQPVREALQSYVCRLVLPISAMLVRKAVMQLSWIAYLGRQVGRRYPSYSSTLKAGFSQPPPHGGVPPPPPCQSDILCIP